MKKQAIKNIFFWIVTGLLSFELVYGALWDFNILNKGYVYDILRHLGYPLYLAKILGAGKLIAAFVISIPGFGLLKEWAYTGVVILFLGGFTSHLFVGDPIEKSVWSLAFAIFGILSWILRPQSKRLTSVTYK